MCVGNSDGWLCVAKLPLDYTEEEFHNLASAYGKVREAFIMISERTGNFFGGIVLKKSDHFKIQTHFSHFNVSQDYGIINQTLERGNSNPKKHLN